MKQRMDWNGAPVRTGDIMMDISCSGGGSGPGGSYSIIGLWQLPASNDGSGFHYHRDGSKSRYWWARLSDSVRLNEDELPDGFLYSFFHGMGRIHIPNEKWFHKLNESPISIIERSDWKSREIKADSVKKAKEDAIYIRKLSIPDRKSFLSELPKIRMVDNFNLNLCNKIFEANGIRIPEIRNGEIGIHFMSMFESAKHIIVEASK